MRHSLILAALVAPAGPVSAGYVIDPTGGTVIFSSGDDDVVSRTLPFHFSFYGGPAVNSITVAINGHLNFSGIRLPFNRAFPSGPTRIAPLWDDLYVYPDSTVVESRTSSTYAVTWDNVGTFEAESSRQSFQAVLVGSNSTINGASFLAGDILFGYRFITPEYAGALSGPGATAGLNSGDGRWTAVPGLPSNGLVTDGNNPFPVGASEYVLFRFDGTNYTSSVQEFGPSASTPVPPTALAGLVGVIGMGLVRRRRAG